VLREAHPPAGFILIPPQAGQRRGNYVDSDGLRHLRCRAVAGIARLVGGYGAGACADAGHGAARDSTDAGSRAAIANSKAELAVALAAAMPPTANVAGEKLIAPIDWLAALMPIESALPDAPLTGAGERLIPDTVPIPNWP